MCGIVGFTGKQQAAPILLDGLSKLEYRGYDSAGLAVRDGEKLAQVVKAKGRLSNLLEKTDESFALSDSPFTLQDCHEHVDALFGEGERKKF